MPCRFYAFTLLAALLLLAAPAQACRFIPQDPAVLAAAAKVAFIGTIRTDEVGLIFFHVEKGIKGVKDGDEFTVEMGKSSCDIRFEVGQRWLYQGQMQMSGSRMLRDEYGRDMVDNMAYAAKTYGADALKGGERVDATLEPTCAPWDGAAFSLKLAGGTIATVYDSLTKLEEKPATAVAVYPLDGKPEHGKGTLYSGMCRDRGEIECRAQTGMLSIGSFDSAGGTGMLDIQEGEHSSRIVFKFTRVNRKVICG
ncbi:MAG: hypothetical protein PW788_14360 [Micavibrio sp.]|nr:hypothetical protein [Micavibrio sp.]